MIHIYIIDQVFKIELMRRQILEYGTIFLDEDIKHFQGKLLIVAPTFCVSR